MKPLVAADGYEVDVVVVSGESVCPIPEEHGPPDDDHDNSENFFANYYGYYLAPGTPGGPTDEWYEDTSNMQFTIIYMSVIALTAGAVIGIVLVYGGFL